MNIYPLVHSFDKKAVEEFIEASDNSVKDICRKIIDGTIYVSFEKTLIELNKRIVEYYKKYNKFHTEHNRPIFIFNPDVIDNKQKSNNWFYTYIYQALQKLFNNEITIISISSILSFINMKEKSILKDDDIIIFPDDCIYSGKQLSSTTHYFAKFRDKYKFYILILYASESGIKLIKDKFFNNHSESKKSDGLLINKVKYNLYSKIIDNTLSKGGTYSNDKYLSIQEKIPINISEDNIKKDINDERLIFSTYIPIPSLGETITHNEFEIFSSFYNKISLKQDGSIDRSNDIIKRDTYLIYFDHKLADFVSVPTVFYLGVVPNEKNKGIITSRNFTGFKDAIDLDVIPLIKKCSHYKTNLNLASPKCPYPPYKSKYNIFLQKIKDKSLSKFSSKRRLKNYSY